MFIKNTLAQIVENRIQELVEGKHLNEWRETLAYSITYSEDRGKALANVLAERLLKGNNINHAILCFIIGNSFGRALELWDKKMRTFLASSPVARPQVLQKLFEKAIVFKTVIKHYGSCETVNELFT